MARARPTEELVLFAECCAVALAAALLVWPLFRIEYLDNWASIESTFMAHARFIQEHWPHPRWLSWWYCGTRFDFIYPPALPYGTAAISMLLHVSTARAYHIFVALLYSLGIAGVFALVRVGSGSRLWAWMGAAATASLSPCFLFLAPFRQDALLHMPQRLNVLVKWGEGPHISALALLPFALALSWRAIRDGGRRTLALAAVASALVVSTNFYATTSLALFFPLLVWSLWIAHRDRRMWWRAVAIAALAYALTAFWLTPSYLRITMENLKIVAQPGNAWSRWTALAVLLAFALASAKLAHRRPHRAWPAFVCGAVLFFTVNVAGHYYFGFRVAGEPYRLVPELDVALILGAVAALHTLAGSGRRWRQAAALAAAATAFAFAWPYLTHPWSVYAADRNYRQRVEYRLTDWIAGHLPGGRVFAAGSVRYWYDVWRNGAQVGGGSDQGMLNNILVLAQWQVTRDNDAARDIAWLQSLGADAIVVTQGASQEIFHEYPSPQKFQCVLAPIFDDGQGDTIYRVPRRFPVHARVVETARVDALRPIPWDNVNQAALAAYRDTVENGPDTPVDMQWEGTDALRVRAHLNSGESLLIQETYDPAWHAWIGGRPIPVRNDLMGYMRLDVPPGDVEARLVFELPLDNVIGRWLTVLSVLILIAVCFGRHTRLGGRKL